LRHPPVLVPVPLQPGVEGGHLVLHGCYTVVLLLLYFCYTVVTQLLH
jgi:hypothetical protein